jgi:protoporphyrinogen oxidase
MVLGQPKDISIAHPMAIFSLMKGMCSMKGGLGAITTGLYEKVKEQVRLNTPVREIVIENQCVKGVRTDQGFVRSDRVICAVDAFTTLQLMPHLPEAIRSPLQTCKYSSTYYYQFGLEKPLVSTKQTPFHVVMIPPGADTILDFVSLGSYSEEKPIVIAPTRGWEDEKLASMSEEERRRLVISDIQKICPAFPDEPVRTKVFRWDRAVNLEAPGQYAAIQDLLKNHYRDIDGLYLAGEYLFLFACTEGAMKTGQQAAKLVAEDITKAHT